MQDPEKLNITPSPGAKIELEERQKILLGILIEFSNICEANGLRYYLDAGTLLGAVRHQGFIPWDDDVDVGMPRPDFERFIELTGRTGGYLKKYIVVARHEITGNSFLRMGDYRTRRTEKHFSDRPVFLDIFPQDGLHALNMETKIVCGYARILSVLYRRCKFTVPGWKSSKHLCKRVIGSIADFLIFDKEVFYGLLSKHIKKYTSRHPFETCRYGTTLVLGEYKKAAEIGYCTDTVDAPFEGYVFKIPRNCDGYLKALYGENYMTPDPPEKRHFHDVACFWR